MIFMLILCNVVENDVHMLLYSVKLVQSKVKSMENLWIIV